MAQGIPVPPAVEVEESGSKSAMQARTESVLRPMSLGDTLIQWRILVYPMKIFVLASI